MADAISADTSIDAMAPLAALCRMVPDQAFTASMRQQVVAMARLGANVPGKLSPDEVRTICRTLLFQIEQHER